MTEIMPEDRERIWAYVRDDLPMWETEPAIGAIPYVRASIADEDRRQRDGSSRREENPAVVHHTWQRDAGDETAL